MKKKFKIITILILLFFTVTGSTLPSLVELPVETIDEILSKEYYSYLPNTAKDYIKENFEETGNVILTEKNKKENEPYLNPDYVEYLTLSSEQKKEIDVIPDSLIVDYTQEPVAKATLESKYNLAELDTNGDGIADTNYTTPMKYQGELGICWAMTTLENAETLIMMKNKKTYTAGETLVLSPRQLDYVTSTNGIKNYDNEYGLHELGDGNSFSLTGKILAEGPTMFSSSWHKTLSLETEQLEYTDVFDSSKSLVEVNKTIEMPVLNIKSLDLTNEEDLQKKTTYINNIKTLIKQYGGPYVGTMAPGYPCAAVNTLDSTKKSIIDVDSTCKRDGSHAMQVIGWDDNYSYKYCIDGNNHVEWTSSCSSQNTVIGQGAWILRNSWGESSTNKYTYLSYESSASYFGFITDLNLDKSWDTTFSATQGNITVKRETKLDSTSQVWSRYYVSLKTDITINAKLYKIKFKTPVQGATMRVYLSVSGLDSDYVKISDQTITYPGYTTVDLSSLNYNITKNSKIFIDSTTSSFNPEFISILTKENTSNVAIITNDLLYQENESTKENGLYKVEIPSETYNIQSGTTVTYEIYNQAGTNITSSTQVLNNVVANNKIYATLYVPKLTNATYYTVKTKINGTILSTSKIYVAKKPSLGSGTTSSPYIITSLEELFSINYYMDSHFVLGTDIDMTTATQTPSGIYYNSGTGWTGIGSIDDRAFTGSLNGLYNGTIHKITGLKIGSNGLFKNIEGSDTNVSIKNIIFKNCIINQSPLLADKIVSYTSSITIENIAAMDCKFTNGRLLANDVFSYQPGGITINSIYSDSTFNNPQNIGLITYRNAAFDDLVSTASLDIKNIEFIGKLASTTTSPALFGVVQGTTNISNIIYNYEGSTSSTLVYVFYASQSNASHIPKLSNVYVTGDIAITTVNSDDDEYATSNIYKMPMDLIVDSSKYSAWANFSTYWNTNTIDSKKRIPTLKFVPFEFSDVTSSITMSEGDTKNVYDYVTPQKDATNNYTITTTDTTKLEITDGKITAKKAGTATVKYTSNYDGLEKDITITIKGSTVNITYVDPITKNQKVESVESGAQINLAANTFQRVGYTFSKWNTKSDGTGTSFNDKALVEVTGNVTLYAIWTPIKYSVKYDANTGTGTMSNTADINYDSSFYLKENTYTKTGYVFGGWSTKSDGTGTIYADKAIVKNLAETATTVTLYAIWIDTSDISNAFIDNEVYYDGKEHTIGITMDISSLNIKYSNNGTTYNLTTIPKYIDAGEYTIWYQITINNTGVVTGSKKLKIYGIKEKNDNLRIKDGSVIIDDSLYTTLRNSIDVYATSYTIKFYDSSNNEITRENIKTGDIIKIKLNNEKEVIYNIARLGDVNGNGTIDIIDYIRIMKDITNDTKLSGIYKYAADMNKNDSIDIIDYIRIMRIIMEGS